MVMNRELKGDVMMIIEKRKKSATFFFIPFNFGMKLFSLFN